MECPLTTFRSLRPASDECQGYHQTYVAHVPDGDIVHTLEAQQRRIDGLTSSVSDEDAATVHAPYTWTIRQVIEHCADAERIFGYRTLRFAASDATDLPGWDENHYANCHYGPNCGLTELGEEFSAIRTSNIRLLSRLNEKAWSHRGTADGKVVSVRTLAWLMAGHWLHHYSMLCHRLGLDEAKMV